MPLLITINIASTILFTLLTLYFEEILMNYEYKCENCEHIQYKKKMSIPYSADILIIPLERLGLVNISYPEKLELYIKLFW